MRATFFGFSFRFNNLIPVPTWDRGRVARSAPRRRLLLAAAAALGAALVAGAPGPLAAQVQRVVALATGDVTGAYFPAGVALCRVMNEGRREHGLRCAALTSEGSLDNVARLRSGEVEFALVQSDVQADAVAGEGAFAGAAFGGLRSVLSLYPEPLALVVRADAGIAALGDLPGKRVSLGPAGSGQRALIEALMAGLGWREGAFAETPELPAAAAVAALCEGRIDAFFFAVGQPAMAIREATSGCGARLVAVDGPAAEAIVASNPEIVAVDIPAGLYAGQDAPVRTLGPTATLVTRAEVAEADVEILAGAILDNLAGLAGFDPTLARLDPAAMAAAGLTAPLHPGAEAALRARGLGG